MTMRDLALEGLEQTLDRILELDPEARRRFAGLHGRVIRLDLRGTGIQLHFVPAQDGRVRLLGRFEGEPDSTLSGSPLDLLRARDPASGHRQLFAGRVSIEGDQALAQRFSEALGGIDIDWEEQLSRLVGDIAAHEIGRAVRAAAAEGRRIGRGSGEDLAAYLTDEAGLVPHRLEVEAFLDRVDGLRDDVERLEARIALLERARGRGEPA